jgi:hypothetical protein
MPGFLGVSARVSWRVISSGDIVSSYTQRERSFSLRQSGASVYQIADSPFTLLSAAKQLPSMQQGHGETGLPFPDLPL